MIETGDRQFVAAMLNRSRILFIVAAIVLLIGSLAARITGPSDLFHQTQPKTIGYTSDIIANGRWILPFEQDMYPATKPPLYNWIAVPFVAVFGFDSEIAHKMPSILALIACVAVTVFVGRRIVRQCEQHDSPLSDRSRSLCGLGWLAAIMLIANYTIFKLGYLARPDMLVTLWLTIAWWSATEIFLRARIEHDARIRSSVPLVLFWTSIALAWLTKGPVAIVPLIYALLGAKLVAGRWRSVRAFKWWVGLPLSTIPFALWVWGVYIRDPDFLIHTLWENELAGRVVGTGSEAPDAGAAAWYQTAGHMFFYYFVRSAPWSVFSIIAMCLLWWKNHQGDPISFKRMTQPLGIWLHAAAVWTVLVLVVFSLSAGKRADYIAAAFPTGALLAAWFWMTFFIRTPLGGAKTWMSDRVRYKHAMLDHLHIVLAILIATGLISVMTVVEWREPHYPEPRYGDRINAFYREVGRTIPDDDEPVLLLRTGWSHLAAFLGRGRDVSRREVFDHASNRRPFWVIEGVPTEESTILADDRRTKRKGMIVTSVLESHEMVRTQYWPRKLIVWHVTFEKREVGQRVP